MPCRILPLLLCCLALSPLLPAEPPLVLQVDFGPKASCAPGHVAVEYPAEDPRFFWKGAGLSMRDRGGDDPLRRDFVCGIRAELSVGLDNGRYEIELLWGDTAYAHGPFDVLVQDRPVAKAVRTAKGQFLTTRATADVQQEVLRIRIVAPNAPANFALAGMTIRGPRQTKPHSLVTPPNKTIPTLAELLSHGEPDPRRALRIYCDWLVAHQTESGSFNTGSSEWYRSGYPVRTLLAGYEIFGHRPYLDAVVVLLDKLVGEQLPNGAWSSGFADKPVARRTKAEIDRAVSGTTNTADVGSISTCLAVAYPHVDAGRKQRYLAALRRFADDYAARFQLPSGGFTNGRWQGSDMTVPYSVATGTQGMSFCALHAITEEQRYLTIAERAAGFLLDNWQPDGRPIHHHHAQPLAQPVPATEFGDVYYYHEAILWVWHWTTDAALKDKIRRVYAWHVTGPQGLLAARTNGIWWPPQHPWVDSKAAAMPLVLLEYDRSMAHDADVHEAVRRAALFLCTPELAARIGVMVDPELPWGQYSMAATGFGGLSLAEMIRPGVIYLKSSHP